MAWKSHEPKWWKRYIPVLVLVAIFLTLWIGGLIAQSSKNMFTPGATTTYNPFLVIYNLPKYGWHGVIILCVFYLVGALFLYARHRDKTRLDTEDDERGFQTEKSGVYGTSSLLDKDGIKDFCEVEPLNRTRGFVLGKLVTPTDQQGKKSIISIPADGKHFVYDVMGRMATTVDPTTKQRVPSRVPMPTNGNKHIAVCGTPGCGKSHCYVKTNIFKSIERRESVIVTDPKGELYGTTAKYAEDHGYVVKILNLYYPQGSDSWDVLAELKDAAQIGIEVQNMCSTIIANTSAPDGKSDPFYTESEKLLLSALVLYVLTSPHYAGKKTLGAVYNLTAKDLSELQDMFNALPNNHPGKGLWNSVATTSGSLFNNLKVGLTGRLQLLDDEVIQEITGTPDIDITLPGKVPCIYYIVMPVTNTTYRFISSLFFSTMFDKLFQYANRQNNQKLPVPTNFIMDEFVAIGTLPNFEKVLATARSADMSFSIIFQNLPQLQNAYPDGLWTSIIGDCFTFLCLSCNDMETAKYLSERSGTATVALEQTRVNRPLFELLNVPNSVQYSYSVGQRAVLQPAEIITLSKTNKILVSIAGADLFLCDKFQFTEMIDPSQLTPLNIYDHSPAWVMQRAKETLTSPRPSETFWGDGATTYQRKYAPPQDEEAHEPIQSGPPEETPPTPTERPPSRVSTLSPDSVDCQEF